MQELIKSPLNYTGGKYKLLPQILPLFPKKIDTFVDVFGGGFNVGINIDAKKVIYNDSLPILAELFEYWRELGVELALEKTEIIIKQYGFSETSKYGYRHYGCDSPKGVASVNKESFLKLRDRYNQTRGIELFYPMLVHAFNNQIRFNKDGDFNGAVNKRDFNKNIRKNLAQFLQKLEQIDIEFEDADFMDLKLKYGEKDFNYFDPPYLGTTATYNENGGWEDLDDHQLHLILDELHNKGGRFALSGVMENKGIENTRLKMWSLKYNVHYLDRSYGNCNYQAKDKSKESTVEVLITNY